MAGSTEHRGFGKTLCKSQDPGKVVWKGWKRIIVKVGHEFVLSCGDQYVARTARPKQLHTCQHADRRIELLQRCYDLWVSAVHMHQNFGGSRPTVSNPPKGLEKFVTPPTGGHYGGDRTGIGRKHVGKQNFGMDGGRRGKALIHQLWRPGAGSLPPGTATRLRVVKRRCTVGSSIGIRPKPYSANKKKLAVWL